MTNTQATLMLIAPLIMIVGGLAMFYWQHKQQDKRK